MRFPSFLLLLLVVSIHLAIKAQSTSTSLTGRVTDQSKAVIDGAKVLAINTNTGVDHDAKSDASGVYSLSGLPPGLYRLEVEKSGFRKLIKPNVILHVQDALAIDFQLTVGPVTESITVEGGAPLVNTESATVSTVIDRTFADNLPLNGRSFQTLIQLTPGVVVTPTAFDDQGQFSVNGQRADANYFNVDGVSANFGVTAYYPLAQTGGGALPALTATGGTNSLVSVDAMQEFRVQTSSFAPEFGRTPGGQVAIVTRSGTNAFHGTVFDYFRNSALDANDWFADLNRLAKPAERQNDFGGVFGGPLVEDKTFFFVSYEGLRLRVPSTEESVVPDTASRQQAQDMGLPILPYLNAYPRANGAELGHGLAQFNATFADPSSLDAYSIRFDQVVNPRVTLFGRYDYSPSSLDERGAFAPPIETLSSRYLLDSTIHTFTVGSTQLLRSQISNEVRGNYSNQRLGTSYRLDDFGGAVVPPNSALYPPGYASSNARFGFQIQGAGDYASGKVAVDEQRQVNLIDNISAAKGTHHLKFGVDYRWLSPISSPSGYFQFAYFTGAGMSPGQALSGKAAAAYVYALESDTLLAHNVSLYGQDTWRATPRLTLTYGLRWDINPPLKGKTLANQPFTVTGLNDPATLALAPRGTQFYQTTYGNLAPRLGVAYQFGRQQDWHAVLRGGFGIFFDLGYGSLGAASAYFPFQTIVSRPLAPFPLSPADATRPVPTTTPPVSAILVSEPNLKLPLTYGWNIALEQSLGNSQTVSLTYVGAAGRDQLRTTNLFNPNPNFAFVSVTSNTATSDYHALQVKFERRLWKGFQALASYTWSHSIDIASTDAFANYLNTPSSVGDPSSDRGDSDFDIRNSFAAGVTYSLPSPGWSAFARAAFGNWSVDAFILARTAPPVNVTSGIVFANGIALYPRPDVVPGVPLELYGSQYPGGKILNKAAFTAPPRGEQGDFGRNVLRAFGATQADVAFQRQFHFTEKLGLRVHGEFFNLFNHPNFGPPTKALTSPLFGYSTETLASSLGSGGASGGLNPLYQIGGPRSIQLALKLQF